MKKVIEIIEKCIYIFLSIMLVAIMLLNIFFQNEDYMCRKDFLLPNIVLLFIALAVLSISGALLFKSNKNVNHMRKKRFSSVNIMSVALFLLLLYFALNIYFFTGWDAGTVFSDAKSLAYGEIVGGTYYSQFPTQQWLLLIETFLLRINNFCGVVDTNEGLFAIIFFQCLLYVITGNVLYRVIDEYSSNQSFAWLGWVLFSLLVAITGWVTIPYTDGMSIVFPVFILRSFQKKENSEGNKKMKWWIIIALLSYWGFKTKPTVLIMLIAILLGEILYGLKSIDRATLRNAARVTIILIICFGGSKLVFNYFIKSTGIEINKELDTGALHMMMMGLNNSKDGVWDADDVELSTGIKDKKERREAQINTIKQRIDDYGLKGLLRHTARKSLVIFNDGSFAWGAEGGFYTQIYEEKNEFISSFLRDLFYSFGHKYKKLATFEQGIWLAVLLLNCLCIFVKRDKFITVVVMSLIGIILFNFLFEARARYVLIYVPLFICTATLVIKQIAEFTFQRIKRV